jgi:hypothetical protein
MIHCLIEAFSLNFYGGTEENTKNPSVRIPGFLAEIRTQHFSQYKSSAFFLNLHIVGGGVQTGSTRHSGHLLSSCARPGWLWGWRIIRWNKDWQGKTKYSEKTCPSATLSTTNPTWPDLGSKPGRRGGKPATNRSTALLLEQSFRWIGFQWSMLIAFIYRANISSVKFILVIILFRSALWRRMDEWKHSSAHLNTRRECSVSLPGRFTSGTHWMEGYMGLRSGLDVVWREHFLFCHRKSSGDSTVIQAIF